MVRLLNAYLNSYLKGATRGRRASTKRNYEDALRPVRERLGDRPLQSLTKADIEDLMDWMLTSGRRRGGKPGTGLSGHSARLTLGRLTAALRDGWALRWDRAVFIPWADVEQIVIYPGPGLPAGSRAPHIGIQRRTDAPELSAGDRPAPGCPLPRVTTAATRPVNGWRLDRDRLAAITATVAPGVPVTDLTAIDTSTRPASILGPPDP